MATLGVKSQAAKPVDRQVCRCGHDVDSHTHPSTMVRDPGTGEVGERFAHGRCTVEGCACSDFADATGEVNKTVDKE